GAALLLWWSLAVTWWPARAALQWVLTRIGATLIAWALATMMLLLTHLVRLPACATLRLLLAHCILLAPLAALVTLRVHTPLRRDGRRRWRVLMLAIGLSVALVGPTTM